MRIREENCHLYNKQLIIFLTCLPDLRHYFLTNLGHTVSVSVKNALSFVMKQLEVHQIPSCLKEKIAY